MLNKFFKGCKCCESKYLEDINDLLLSGVSPKNIVVFLKKKDVKIPLISIERHAKQHLEDYVQEVDVKPFKSELIQFKEYLGKIGLTIEDFNDLEKNLDKIIYGSQKAMGLILFKNLAIVDNKLDRYIQEKASYPVDEIKGLKIVHDIMSNAIALNEIVNPNAAIKTLESRGYTISQE